eukprot:12438882-Alexandrium_andersonii.AAC.1
MASKQDARLVLSPPAPGALKASAGVGLMAKKDRKLVQVQARTKAMQAHIDAGRCIIGMVDVGRSEPLVVASVYGWQGSSTDCKARKRTREL